MCKRFAGFSHGRLNVFIIYLCCLQIFACTSTEQQPDRPNKTASPQRSQSSTLQVTFETTEANRQRARDADQPVLLKGQAPVYPAQLIDTSVGNGWVELQITVSTDGSVASTQVLSSSHQAFEAAAIASVQKWQFEPPTEQKSIRHRVFFKHEPADHYQPQKLNN